MSNTKPMGLRLTLGGAPDTPHTVAGLPGLYRPGAPTPVGGPGEATLEQAQAAHDAAGVPVELVEIPSGDLDRLRGEQTEQRQAARSAARKQRRASAVESDRIDDETAAAAAPEED
jgi:hypothetical protein